MHARQFGIVSISLRPPDVVFVVDQVSSAEPVFAHAPGTVRMPDARTVHLRPPANYLEPPTLLAVLQQMLKRAVAKVEAAT